MSPEFWISTAIELPIGIGAGLAVAPIQRWYASRGQTREVARLNRVIKEYTDTVTYLRSPEIYNQFHLKILISMVEGTSIWLLGAVVVLMIVGDQTHSKIVNLGTTKPLDIFTGIELVIAGLAMTAGLAIFMQAVKKYKSAANRVTHFARYRETVPAAIRDIEAEVRFNLSE